jgi:hypothetical protein
MNSKDFLKLVWPDQGFYCVATPNATRTGYRHYVFVTLDDAYSHARSLYNQFDVYFGVHAHINQFEYNQRYNRNTPCRKKHNMRAARCLFLDLDVGKGTKEKPKYPTQAAALAALAKLIFQTNLPEPVVVSSGNGVHVYWPFEDEVPSEDWRQHAANLRLLLDKHGMLYDPSRTTDITSVLRVPATLNHKDPANLKKVEILFTGEKFPSVNTTLFGMLALQTAGLQRLRTPTQGMAKDMSNITPGLLGFPPTDADDVAAECEQMRIFRDTKGNIPEHHWYAGLGILGFCTNGAQVAHQWSSGHPNYSAQETDNKLAQWKANGSVTSCAKLGADGAPNVCARCPHFGGPYKNPIVIVNKKPLTQAFVAATSTMQPAPTILPPHPYSRLAGMGVVKDTGVGAPAVVMKDVDLYPIATASGVINGLKINNGVSTWVAREHNVTQQTLSIQFDVPNELLSDPKAMSVHFAAHGLYHPATVEVVRYMSAYLKELKRHVGMTVQHPHIGWKGKDDLSEFVLAGKVIDPKGDVHECTMAPSTKIATDGMGTGGTLPHQVAALSFYNHPAYSASKFMFLASLSSPLFMATGHHGVVINASGDSSAGKSTALRAAAAVWGDPDKFVVNGTARGMSAMARDLRMTVMGNLPTMIDEITHMDPDDARATVMSVSQNQLRTTLTSGREVREKPTGFRSAPLLSTGNSDLHQTIGIDNKAAGTAGSARILQLPFDLAAPHTKDQIDAFNHNLSANFGWIGAYILSKAMPCMPLLFESVQEMVRQINQDTLAKGVERFTVAAAAPVFVMGAFAAYHGIIEWDIDELYHWFLTVQHPALRAQMTSQAQAVAPDNVIREFLSANVNDTVETDEHDPSNLPMPMVRNRVVVHVRREINEVWVSQDELKDWCSAKGIPYESMIVDLKKGGLILKTNARKYMGQGTKYQLARNRVVVLAKDKL